PDPRNNEIVSVNQTLPVLRAWSQSADFDVLAQLGSDLGAAVNLEIDSTNELAQLLFRSASSHADRGGTISGLPQDDWGSNSWRQRLLALLFGGNPLGNANEVSEIDLGTVSSDQVAAAGFGAVTAQVAPSLGPGSQKSVPWDTTWTINSATNGLWPGAVLPFSAGLPYSKTPMDDPHVAQLLALAREANGRLLKELSEDFSNGLVVDRTIDVDTSAPQLFTTVEAWVRTIECRKTTPGCTVAVNDPSIPTVDQYQASLLWQKYGIQPSHARALVSM